MEKLKEMRLTENVVVDRSENLNEFSQTDPSKLIYQVEKKLTDMIKYEAKYKEQVSEVVKALFVKGDIEAIEEFYRLEEANIHFFDKLKGAIGNNRKVEIQ